MHPPTPVNSAPSPAASMTSQQDDFDNMNSPGWPRSPSGPPVSRKRLLELSQRITACYSVNTVTYCRCSREAELWVLSRISSRVVHDISTGLNFFRCSLTANNPLPLRSTEQRLLFRYVALNAAFTLVALTA